MARLGDRCARRLIRGMEKELLSIAVIAALRFYRQPIVIFRLNYISIIKFNFQLVFCFYKYRWMIVVLRSIKRDLLFEIYFKHVKLMSIVINAPFLYPYEQSKIVICGLKNVRLNREISFSQHLFL